MIPLAIPNLCGNEAAYLQECVDSTFVSTVGPFVSRFEAMVAEAVDSPGAVATASGTCGLHAALTAVGVGPGDLVIVPSLTFIASANAVAHCGAEPWLFDVEPDCWTLSASRLRRELDAQTHRDGDSIRHTATGRRVATVMPVYTLGIPPDMSEITALARERGLPVVADAAAALGAELDGGLPIGRSGADLQVISFNGNKTVTAGGGGAVIGDDTGLLALVRHLTTTARVGDDYEHDRVGFNYRMTNLQAAVGCAQMENLGRLTDSKHRIHKFYASAFRDLSDVDTFPEPLGGKSANWLSGIVAAPPLAGSCDVLRGALQALGIDARPFWKPVHLQTPYLKAPRTAMPVCEELWQRIVTLPSSTNLTDIDLEWVAGSVVETIRSLRT